MAGNHDEHYTHAIDADDQMAADQIGALLSPKETRQPMLRWVAS
jgi:hypothetical protein